MLLLKVLYFSKEILFVLCLFLVRLAPAWFREDREELCDNSRGRSSLDSLNGEDGQYVFVRFVQYQSTHVLQLDYLASQKSTSETRPYENTNASRRSSLVQPSRGLQRVLQLHQSEPLAGNNPVSALHRRTSQSAARLPRTRKNAQKSQKKPPHTGILSSRTNSPRTHIQKVGENLRKKFRGAQRAPKTHFWG